MADEKSTEISSVFLPSICKIVLAKLDETFRLPAALRLFKTRQYVPLSVCEHVCVCYRLISGDPQNIKEEKRERGGRR